MSILYVALETVQLQSVTGVLLPMQQQKCGELYLTACSPIRASPYKASFWFCSFKKMELFLLCCVYIIVIIWFYYLFLIIFRDVKTVGDQPYEQLRE